MKTTTQPSETQTPAQVPRMCKMPRSLAALLLGATISLSSGCASIVSNTDKTVFFSSEPNAAQLTIKDRWGDTVFQGTTPTSVKLGTGAGFFVPAEYHVTASKADYKTEKSILSARLDGWYIGNLFFGGLLGMLIIDPATGAMWELDETHLSFRLQPNNMVPSETRQSVRAAPSQASQPTKREVMPPVETTSTKSTVAPKFVPLDIAEEQPKQPVPKVLQLSNEIFDASITKGVAIVEFSSAKAPKQDTLLEDVAKEVGSGILVARFSLENSKERVKQYNIKMVPTFIVFKDGSPVSTFVGFRDKKVFLDAINDAR